MCYAEDWKVEQEGLSMLEVELLFLLSIVLGTGVSLIMLNSISDTVGEILLRLERVEVLVDIGERRARSIADLREEPMPDERVEYAETEDIYSDVHKARIAEFENRIKKIEQEILSANEYGGFSTAEVLDDKVYNIPHQYVRVKDAKLEEYAD